MDEQGSSETEFLERVRNKVHIPSGSALVRGIGDDCAIYRPPGAGEDLVFTTDLLLEDIHFLRETHSAPDVGHKVLARGLSDLASMGAEPRFVLLSLAAPRWADEAWLEEFYDGFLVLASEAGAVLAGGDLARAPKFAADIVACGAVPIGSALRRDGARAGDSVWVSGLHGGSALGLETRQGAAWGRHLRPRPRLALGRALRESGGVTAAMDLSDGISLDLRRLCLSSHVVAEITAPPQYPGASLEQALHGGEDYELLFTADRAIPDLGLGIPLTCIGTLQEPGQWPAGTVLLDGVPLSPRGYDHFRRQ